MRPTLLLAAVWLPLLTGQPKDLNRESDADGFGNLKWGMTVVEAKEAFPGLVEPERAEMVSGGFQERLIQPVLMVGSVEMTVAIETKADSDRITRVVLKLAPFVQRKANAFKFLTNDLILKYGPPSRQDSTMHGRKKESIKVWMLPSTTVTLDWLANTTLEITYEAVNKKDSNSD